MAFDDRLQFLLLGMAIGFVLGYLVRLVRDIKEELDEVKEEIETGVIQHHNGDDGYMKVSLSTVAILLVVGLTAWASFVSQKASNDVKDAQERIEQTAECHQQVLEEALVALNQRSTFTKASAKTNVQLQKSQRAFLTILLHRPPFSEAKRTAAVRHYYRDLGTFLDVAKKNTQKVSENPFPEPGEMQKCMNDAQNEEGGG